MTRAQLSHSQEHIRVSPELLKAPLPRLHRPPGDIESERNVADRDTEA